MDDHVDIRRKNDELEEIAREINMHRVEASKNETKFMLILASKEAGFRKVKSNAGMDAMILMLLGEGDEETQAYFKKWKHHNSKYKGLEHIEKAIIEKIHAEKFLGKIE